MKKVANDSTVTVNYTGRLEDGTVFDSSMVEGREPLKTQLGQGQLIEGFEKGLIDMSVGDKKTIEIDPQNAYGEYNPDMITTVNKTQFPADVKVGEKVMVAHGRWTRGVKVREPDGTTTVVRMVDPKDILVVMND